MLTTNDVLAIARVDELSRREQDDQMMNSLTPSSAHSSFLFRALLGLGFFLTCCRFDEDFQTTPIASIEAIGTKQSPIIKGDLVPEADSGVLLLEVDATATCTAVLLSNQWATTAAHCLSGVGPVYTLKMDAERIAVDRFYSHPTLDIALLHTSSPFTMNGSTSGYQRPIFSGDAATLVGQDLACYGFGANSLATGLGTLRVGKPIRVSKMVGTTHYEIAPNARGQIAWMGDDGGPCIDATGSMTGIQSTCYFPTGPGRFSSCQQVAMTDDIRTFFQLLQLDFIKTCSAVLPDPVHPGEFVCDGEATTFNYRRPVSLLVKLKKVKSNHRFKVKMWADGPMSREFTSVLKSVGASGVENSYYSIDFPLLDSGNFFVRVYVEAEDGRGFAELGTYSFLSKYPYKWSLLKICSSVVAPGTCVGATNSFTKGDVVHSLMMLEDIGSDYRFSLELWKEGALQFDFIDRWRSVRGGVVAKDFFSVPYLPNTAGNWEVRPFVELADGKGRRALPISGFHISEPYEYTWSDLCTAIGFNPWGFPICDGSKRVFRSAENWHLLTRLDWLRRDVRVKHQLFYEGAFNHESIHSWHLVSTLNRAYFEWSGGSLAPGNWAMKVFVEANDGKGFQYFETVPFVVVP